MKYIPQIQPWIDSTELKELASVIESTFITEHTKTEEFLNGIKRVTGAPQAIAVCNGTLALVAALMAAGVREGDSVIVPDLTFIASSNAVRILGARPIFCDVNLKTGCMDIESVQMVMEHAHGVKAVMPVHLYGQMVEMDKLNAFAADAGLEVIEDAAEALGVTYKGGHAGTFSRFGTLSFYANKTITCGEGGVILCRTPEDYATLYRIKNHGRDRKGTFVHETIGYNFCFTDLQAAIGVAQLRKFDQIMENKRRIFELYVSRLSDTPLVTVVTPPSEVRSNYWFINILVDNAGALKSHLEQDEIESRRYFYPMHMQPCNADIETIPCPNSRWLYDHGLSLPSGSQLTDDQVERVCDSILDYVGN